MLAHLALMGWGLCAQVATASVAQPALSSSSLSVRTATAAEGLAEPVEVPELVFSGNVVFIPEVYETVLRLAGWGSEALSDKEQEAWLERTLTAFLHDSGYELASVLALRERDHVELLIDEGKLDKIIFRKQDPWTTVQLLFIVNLPGDVFNRPLVERRLELAKAKLRMREVQYEVVPVNEPVHRRLQLDDPHLIEGLTLFRRGEPHELRVSFEKEERRPGLSLGIGVQPPDGLAVEAGWYLPSSLLPDDVLEVDGRFGLRLGDFGKPGNRIGLSVAGLGGLWSSPRFADAFRLLVEARGRLEARRREDLRLANYYFAPVRGGLGISAESGGVLVRLGGGLEHRTYFGPRADPELSPPPPPDLPESEESVRSYVEGTLDIELNPQRLRRDRPHRVQLSGQVLWPVTGTQGTIYKTGLRYLNTIAVGFDELRYELAGTYMGGAVPFYGEVAMGEGFLRASFQGTVYTEKVGALGLEYRFSLARDTFKLGIFNDLAVYDRLNDRRESERLGVIDSFGLGFHVLLVDAFQLSGYFGIGFRESGESDLGFSVDVKEAF